MITGENAIENRAKGQWLILLIALVVLIPLILGTVGFVLGAGIRGVYDAITIGLTPQVRDYLLGLPLGLAGYIFLAYFYSLPVTLLAYVLALLQLRRTGWSGRKIAVVTASATALITILALVIVNKLVGGDTGYFAWHSAINYVVLSVFVALFSGVYFAIRIYWRIFMARQQA
jgi:hypothetical protein